MSVDTERPAVVQRTDVAAGVGPGRRARWGAGRAAALIVAGAFVFGPAIAYGVGVRAAPFENHKLAEAPDPGRGWSALSELAPWATDHLPGRETAVRASAWIDFYVLGGLPRNAVQSGAKPDVGSAGSSPTASRDPRKAPKVVRGRSGYLFLGDDFDAACRTGLLRRGLSELRRLSDIIERSGRRVVYTVGPNKSAVDTDLLPSVLPHGACATNGLRVGNALLDGVDDPRWVELRPQLAAAQAAGEQVFWRNDTHWTPIGADIVGHQVARVLDPALAARLTTRTEGTATKTGDLTKLVGLTTDESMPLRAPFGGGTVRQPKGSYAFVNRWTTTPATGLVPGRTLMVGDSFGYYSLTGIRPLIADGTFLWVGNVPRERIISEIVASDTVILEIVQRLGSASPLTNPALVKDIETALSSASR